MSTKSRSTKRKPCSPADKISNIQRRRFLPYPLPDLSETIVNSSDNMDSATPMPHIETSNGSFHHQQTPLPFFIIKGKHSVREILVAFKNQNLVIQVVHALAEAIKSTLQHAVECAFKTLTEKIQSQSELLITKQNERIDSLTGKLNDADKTNQDLQHQIWGLVGSLEDLKQYSRRTSLRFHNCNLQNKQSNTDHVIINICKDKLGM